jgi:hypothetical protein
LIDSHGGIAHLAIARVNNRGSAMRVPLLDGESPMCLLVQHQLSVSLGMPGREIQLREAQS